MNNYKYQKLSKDNNEAIFRIKSINCLWWMYNILPIRLLCGSKVLMSLLIGIIFLLVENISAVTTRAMVVYTELNSQPVYRTFIPDTTSWAEPSEASDLSDENTPGVVVWSRLVSAPSWIDRPDEKVLVTLDTMGRLKAQVWDGSQWLAPQFITSDFDLANVYMRGFDVAYSSNIVFIVYARNNSADDNQLAYVTWDGTNWGTETVSGYIKMGTEEIQTNGSAKKIYY